MVDMYPKVSNAVKYDSMNISLEGSSFRNSWQGEISNKFVVAFRRLEPHNNTIFSDLVCVVCFGY